MISGEECARRRPRTSPENSLSTELCVWREDATACWEVGGRNNGGGDAGSPLMWEYHHVVKR